MGTELEKMLLGALIFFPRLLEATDISEDDFNDWREKKIFREIFSIYSEFRSDELDIAILSDRLKDDGLISFLSSCISGGIKLDEASFRMRLTELRKKNQLKKIHSLIHQQAEAGDLSFEELEPEIEKYKGLENQFDLSKVLKGGEELQQLDIFVDWVVENLVPSRSITILFGPGGCGKTTVVLQIANAVSGGAEIFGLKTEKKSCVYLDYESPQALLVEKLKRLEVCRGVFFWGLWSEPRPPFLDSDNFNLLFNLPQDSVLIFDSLRSCHNSDENSSRDMAFIFNRLKVLREAGYSIIIVHHSVKGDEKIFRGSASISDLADHTLNFFIFNREEMHIDSPLVGPDVFYFLGCTGKSRYERYSLFLNFDGKKFSRSGGPDHAKLIKIHEFLLDGGNKNQSEIVRWCREELGITKKGRVVDLLDRGERLGLWVSATEGRGKPHIYYPRKGTGSGTGYDEN